ncbi:MAG TPA: GNAT family N-acetyltransferase [Thermoanaerobaculia bacterium]|nr:GNAT family N-acetyltransferase [Thermoanaerobaculia bacterium]
MSLGKPCEPADLALLLPDEPVWVDLRGMLLSNRCTVFVGEDGPARGFVARSWDFPYAMAAGEPETDVVHRAVATDSGETSEWHLLAGLPSVAAVEAALPGWRRRGVTLHRWAGDDGPDLGLPPAPSRLDVRLAPAGWAAAGFPIDHLPEAMRDELTTEHARHRPLAAVFVEGRPVSVCYAAFETEGLWDVAIETLAEHRRRGLAAACFGALASWLAGRGRRPVWGALDGNEPSLRLAAVLGFEPVAQLTSFVRPTGFVDATRAPGGPG